MWTANVACITDAKLSQKFALFWFSLNPHFFIYYLGLRRGPNFKVVGTLHHMPSLSLTQAVGALDRRRYGAFRYRTTVAHSTGTRRREQEEQRKMTCSPQEPPYLAKEIKEIDWERKRNKIGGCDGIYSIRTKVQ